ncbi:anhydro-N-acetylmuramic acid kinase [Brachybacterium muris]|uniref:anhydro-N-acetylmuramic acid kinase n=1 Tax=Brachybacterium muris TaxID=219301 RepID=UPI00223C17A8|nr:anhydro-N-acetylmuramic acid kinase [Brachybacterium muris]MCT2177839.1 anhydro-N-acetylmuramic acid kinase [Brachybacterium muris]
MMSGTSLDAIDVALVELSRDQDDPATVQGRILHHGEHPWPAQLRRDLLAVLPPSTSDVGTWCRLHAQVGDAFADAARAALNDAADTTGAAGTTGVDAPAVGGPADLICTHGQTLYHWVQDGRAHGTLQIGDASRIAAATGLPVLFDVRSADVARGGHGAPLVPVLDQLVFGDRPTAVINIGGIANVSLVGAGDVIAGDIGPGNALIDAAVLRGTDGEQTCDLDGHLARAGRVDEELLDLLLAEPFYAAPMPRSTGREHFDAAYVDRLVAQHGLALATGRRLPDLPDLSDLVATLTELTALTIARAVQDLGAQRVVLSGGGIHNPVLRARLGDLLAGSEILAPETVGIPADAKEAVLMALLGWLSAEQVPAVPARADGTAVTGATAPTVLGSLTPAGALPPAQHPGRPVRRLRFTPTHTPLPSMTQEAP